MTTASHPAGQPVPQTPAADVLAELTAVLAGMTGTDAHLVDPGLPFPLLGLDSLRGVEFLGALGARYGTRIEAGALGEHPTPAALSRHIAARLGAPDGPAPSPSASPSPAPAPVRARIPRDEPVLTALRTQLARILRCAPGDLDDRAPFTVLGLDSILAAEFVEGINRTWGLKEQAALLYDHPDLAAMATHLTERLGVPAPAPKTAGSVPAPAPAAGSVAASAPARAGAAAPAAPPLDLDALLDAVRDDVLGIDEAAALLAARTA
ncbi:acyl carrier protein [Streptomyces sp. NPDC044571]|uniref:acyl carrier protein n=1 Tax=Streptomyces sp. NPDC044571 TaxID=3155371 RepID=UPI0034040A26